MKLRAFAALPLFIAPALAEDWPQWLGPNRDGVSAERGWNRDWSAKRPAKLWEAELGAGGACVAVVGDRLFSTGNDREETDTVFCLNAKTGQEVWRFSYPCPYKARMFDGGTASTPTVQDGKVYVGSYTGLVFCLDAERGKEIWRKDLLKDLSGDVPHWGYAASPLVSGDRVYVDPGKRGGAVAALDKNTGAPLWKAGDQPTSYSSFTLAGDLLLSFNADGLFGVEAATGKERFRAAWKTPYDINVPVPLVKDGEFFISSGYGKGAGLFRWDGSKLTNVYESKELFTQFQNAVRFGDHLYGVHGDNTTKAELRCLEWATGKVRWKQRLVGNRGNVTVADGMLLILAERGEIILAEASPDGYRERGRFQAVKGRCWTPPVLAHGLLYCRSTFGKLACWDLR